MSEHVRIIDIPAGHVREVDRDYYESNYTRLNQNGEQVPMGETPYIVVRNSDSKVFKLAGFVPYGWKSKDCVYLEEL